MGDRVRSLTGVMTRIALAGGAGLPPTARATTVPVLRWVVLFVTALLGSTSVALADVIVPSALVATEGNRFEQNGFNAADTQRYQQVFEASEFPGPVTIVELRFRRDGVNTTFSFILDAQFNLSTTQKGAADGANELSFRFADNVGADDTVVLPRTAFTFSSVAPDAVPQAFDAMVTFTTPFSYDPAAGNLLLDLRRHAPKSNLMDDLGGGLGFDGIEFADPATAVTARRFSFDVNASQALLADNIPRGMVVQFVTVPEPSAYAIVAALGAVAVAARRRGKR